MMSAYYPGVTRCISRHIVSVLRNTYLFIVISPRCEDTRSSTAPAKETTDLFELELPQPLSRYPSLLDDYYLAALCTW